MSGDGVIADVGWQGLVNGKGRRSANFNLRESFSNVFYCINLLYQQGLTQELTSDIRTRQAYCF